MKKSGLATLLVLMTYNMFSFSQGLLPINRWTPITIDSIRETYGGTGKFNWLRPMGLDAADIDHDGYKDILCGWYLYHNPGNDMSKKWTRTELPLKVDGFAFVDVDDDEYLDILAQALPDVYWLEAKDPGASLWTVMKIGEVPVCADMNSQGYAVADMIPGGKPEIILSTGSGAYMFEIPEHPEQGNWPVQIITDSKSDEGIAVGDIDKDGIPDLVCGDIPENDQEGLATLLYWHKNPGKRKENWQKYLVGSTRYPIDRIRVADFNEDGQLEIVVTEDRWNVIRPIADIFVFNVSDRGINYPWDAQKFGDHYSLNSLDVGDIDNDGNTDIVTSEHKGPDLKTFIYLNDGKGHFREVMIYKGIEMHLGTKLVDMDNDGDLDIIGPSWDRYKDFNMVRNDAILINDAKK
jgi:hypothetical protein